MRLSEIQQVAHRPLAGVTCQIWGGVFVCLEKTFNIIASDQVVRTPVLLLEDPCQKRLWVCRKLSCYLNQ